MPKFKVKFDWSGYSRGYTVREIEAQTKEEALEKFHDYEGDEIEHVIVRNDTERDNDSIEIEEIK